MATIRWSEPLVPTCSCHQWCFRAGIPRCDMDSAVYGLELERAIESVAAIESCCDLLRRCSPGKDSAAMGCPWEDNSESSADHSGHNLLSDC